MTLISGRILEATPKERLVLDALVEAWNHFTKLPEEYLADSSDFCDAIHTTQRIILARITLRTGGRSEHGS